MTRFLPIRSQKSASLFTDARLVKMAENLKLDMTAFNQCYQAKKYASDIQNDISRAISLNIYRHTQYLR